MISLAIGGALGAISRYYISEWAKRHRMYPLAISIVNITGSFFFGYIVIQSQAWSAFLCAGFLGGFTTFSTFVIDFYDLLNQNKGMHALFYFFFSIICSFAACFVGLLLGGM